MANLNIDKFNSTAKLRNGKQNVGNYSSYNYNTSTGEGIVFSAKTSPEFYYNPNQLTLYVPYVQIDSLSIPYNGNLSGFTNVLSDDNGKLYSVTGSTGGSGLQVIGSDKEIIFRDDTVLAKYNTDATFTFNKSGDTLNVRNIEVSGTTFTDGKIDLISSFAGNEAYKVSHQNTGTIYYNGSNFYSNVSSQQFIVEHPLAKIGLNDEYMTGSNLQIDLSGLTHNGPTIYQMSSNARYDLIGFEAHTRHSGFTNLGEITVYPPINLKNKTTIDGVTTINDELYVSGSTTKITSTFIDINGFTLLNGETLKATNLSNPTLNGAILTNRDYSGNADWFVAEPNLYFTGSTLTITGSSYKTIITHSGVTTKSIVAETGLFNSGLTVNGNFTLNGTSYSAMTSGTSGTSGSSGVNGQIGSSGTNGSSGSSGTSGTSGTSGSSGTNGSSGNTYTQLYYDPVNYNLITENLTVSKLSGTGIKVDTSNPTFGFKDLIGQIQISPLGANLPTLNAFRGGNILTYAFSVNDTIDNIIYHLPHDYLPGSDLYIHTHWGHNGTAISGSFAYEYYISYCKGYNQSGNVFGSEITVSDSVSITSVTTHPRYSHNITEKLITSATGSTTTLDRRLLEVDGIIMVGFKVTTIPTITGGSPNEPFVFMIDIHYQSNGVLGTKDKNYPFYV